MWFIENVFDFFFFSCPLKAGTAGASVINRGCVRNGGSTSQTCLRSNNYVDNLTECQICSGDGCNSSSGLISSLFLIVSTIFIVLRINWSILVRMNVFFIESKNEIMSNKSENRWLIQRAFLSFSISFL